MFCRAREKGGRSGEATGAVELTARGHLVASSGDPTHLCQVLDGTAALPAQRKARREYENRVNALLAASLR